MFFEGVFVFGSNGEGYATIVIVDFIVFAWARVGEVHFLRKELYLVVSEAEPPFLVFAGCKFAVLSVCSGWRYSFSVDEIQFVAIPERGGSFREGSFLDVVKGSLASQCMKIYGDYLVL